MITQLAQPVQKHKSKRLRTRPTAYTVWKLDSAFKAQHTGSVIQAVVGRSGDGVEAHAPTVSSVDAIQLLGPSGSVPQRAKVNSDGVAPAADSGGKIGLTGTTRFRRSRHKRPKHGEKPRVDASPKASLLEVESLGAGDARVIGKGGLSSTSRGVERVNTPTQEGPEHTVSGSCDDSEMGFTPICVIWDREEWADHPSTLLPRELNAG